jgi:hypothetical protein
MTERIEYARVRLVPEGLEEWDELRRRAFVDRERVESLELRRGPPGERPVFQTMFGLSLVVVGAWIGRATVVRVAMLLGMIPTPRDVAPMPVTLSAASFTLVAFGVLAMVEALRPRFFLFVAVRVVHRASSSSRKKPSPRSCDRFSNGSKSAGTGRRSVRESGGDSVVEGRRCERANAAASLRRSREDAQRVRHGRSRRRPSRGSTWRPA